MMLCLDGAHVLLTAALEGLLARSLLPVAMHNWLADITDGFAQFQLATSLVMQAARPWD